MDSIIITIMITDSEAKVIMSNDGKPKWKGRTTLNQCALPTPEKSTMSSATAAMKPMMMPDSTAILARKPFA